MREQSIFIEALERTDPAERSAYLDRACAADPALRERIERLFRRHEQSGDFLDRPPFWAEETAAAPALKDADPVVGPYKLLEPIGEGGMGTVYMAEQTEPVRRRVALKVIKPGMDSRQVVARFEAERQALALMDHPNIARVLDAGMTPAGRPYFVMELVRGLPITDYCDREELTVPERLELFVLVCRAVQHAHQKGVIHRDLKPSNVLVTVIDGVAVPKVIDFGVAKATGQALTDKTLFTGFHQFVGTPLYVSPEQADLAGVDVDTRSDIYSLGVLLYELLTGTTPFDSETLKRAAFDEMRRMIREEEPPRPSTRLSSLGERLSTVSARRKADPRRLGSSLKGELDWVVMKALEKDRRRRYETANDFAADVMRFLTDRPVEACPPSSWYRFAKYARRNRTVLTTTALVGLTLVAGMALSTWQAIRATQASTLAGRREREARDSAAESRSILQFLISDVLGASEPEENLGADIKVAEVLANTEKKVEGAFPDRPSVEAGVRHALAHAYHSLGRYAIALRHASRALDLRRTSLGPEHPDTLTSMANVADLFFHVGRWMEARALGEQTLEIARRALGPKHPDTLKWMNNLAIVLESQGRYEEARTLDEQVLEVRRRVLGPEHPNTLASMSNLASDLAGLGKPDEARTLNEQVLEVRRRVLGPEHPDTLASIGNAAEILAGLGRYDEAGALQKQVLEVRRRVLGPEHPDTLKSMHRLAWTLTRQRKYDEARAFHEQALEGRRHVLGADHPDTLSSMYLLAGLLHDLGRLHEARELLEQTLEARHRVLGAEHPHTANVAHSLVQQIGLSPDASQGDWERALELARRGVERNPGDAHRWMWLSAAEYRNGHWDSAIRAVEKSIERRPDGFGGFLHLIRALALARRGETDEARAWYDKVRPAVEGGMDLGSGTPRWLIDEAASLLGERPPGDGARKTPAPGPTSPSP